MSQICLRKMGCHESLFFFLGKDSRSINSALKKQQKEDEEKEEKKGTSKSSRVQQPTQSIHLNFQLHPTTLSGE